MANKSGGEILVDELSEGLEFSRRKGVETTWRKGLIVLEFDLEIVRTVLGKSERLFFAEDVGEVVILFRNVG